MSHYVSLALVDSLGEWFKLMFWVGGRFPDVPTIRRFIGFPFM